MLRVVVTFKQKSINGHHFNKWQDKYANSSPNKAADNDVVVSFHCRQSLPLNFWF